MNTDKMHPEIDEYLEKIAHDFASIFDNMEEELNKQCAIEEINTTTEK